MACRAGSYHRLPFKQCIHRNQGSVRDVPETVDDSNDIQMPGHQFGVLGVYWHNVIMAHAASKTRCPPASAQTCLFWCRAAGRIRCARCDRGSELLFVGSRAGSKQQWLTGARAGELQVGMWKGLLASGTHAWFSCEELLCS